MPFHESNSSSSSSQQNARQERFSTTSGILQAAQTLGSVGAPTGNLRGASTGTTAAGTDRLYSNPSTSGLDPRAPPSSIPSSAEYGFYQTIASGNATSTSYGHSSYNPTRSQPYNQDPDELHLTPVENTGLGAQTPRRELNQGGAPRINIEQSTPGTSHQKGGEPVPASLHPGRSRANPEILPFNSTPTRDMAHDAYNTPSRSGNMSHSYSRSSPSAGGYDGTGFTPFAGGPAGSDLGQYSSPTSKYAPQNQQRNVSNTPLGLADIRPRADSSLQESLPGANPYSYDGANAQPTNSNYLAPWAIYAFDWCKWPAHGHDAGKVAVGSYLEDGHNFIQILETGITTAPSESYTPGTSKRGVEFSKIAEATHSYPVTRLLWEPPSSQKQSTDLLATSGDHLRLWSLPSDTPMASQSNSINNRGRDAVPTKLTPLALLSNSKTPEHTAPLTSLDWNTVSPSLIITSSIDTTCTIWDIPTLTAKTQLIAHDKEVFDVRFCANSVDVFVSCGADGSVRMFDLRSLEHSTIIYEPTAKDDKDPNSATGRMSPTLAQQTMSYAPPLLRLAASPHDTHLLATFSQDSKIIRILDVRQPGQALLELHGHSAAINCIEWSPNRRGTLASGGDDSMVLIWDLLAQSTSVAPTTAGANGTPTPDNGRGPAASWTCDYEVGNISWAPHSQLSHDGDWLGVSGGRGIWGVKL